MATSTTQGTTSALVLSQQDTDDFLAEYKDTYETIVTTIPRDGSLTKLEFIKQYEALSKAFQDRLTEVAIKTSKLQTLVSFVNTIAKDSPTSTMCSDEDGSETEEDTDFHQIRISKDTTCVTETVIYSKTSPADSNISNNMDGNNEVVVDDASTANEHISANFQIMKKDIQWLSVPFLAVEKNNIEVVDMCINTGMDLETFRNLKGQTLLGHSVELCNLNHDIINVLLKCIGVNIGANDGETPIMTCIKNREISVKERFVLLERLIDAGADVMTRSFHLGTTLHEFIFSLAMEMDVTKLKKWESVIDILLTRGVDINAVDFFGQTALICAITIVPPTGLEDTDEYDSKARRHCIDARRCKSEIVEYLLNKGADLDVTANYGNTALCIALANQNIDIVDILIKHGANVNHKTNVKMSPAYVICCEGDWSEEQDIEAILFPSLHILLNAGLDLNIKGIDDSTVLHFAAAKLNHTICEFLVKSGADIEARDYLQRSPLHLAVRNSNSMVTKTLIKLGADIEAKDIHEDTPLTHACLHGNTNAVQILIENGADYKASGDLGIQPIHIAAENGDSLMIEILQNVGCDLSTTDASESTPLHYAASDGNPDTVQYLLNQNVNKNCKNSQGLVPLDLALLRGEYRVSTLLADSSSVVKFGRLPPGLFPNRPLRKMHELDDYLEEIAEPLKTIGESGVDIGKAILDTPGLGRLHLNEGESKCIYESIHQLCMEIVERIGELDPLFQCKLINAGSSFEGVKVGYPDEFDFVCHIEKISSFIEKVENVDIPEYCQIIMKDSLPPDISRFCLRSKKSLNAGALLRHFCRLTRIASYDVLKNKHQNIYSGFILLNESSVVFGDSPIPLAKLQGFTVSWRGPTYKHIDVSIDINPVLFTTEWPSKAACSCILLPNIKKEGMYLIPKYCSKSCFAVTVEKFSPDSELWRYSTHHVEAIMMRSLPQEARDSYMLCKAFRMEPLTCSVQVQKIYGWMSETDLQKLFPLDEQGMVIPYDDDDNDGDYRDDDYDGDDDDLKGKERRNEANNECRTESGNIDIVNDEEEHSLDCGEQESIERIILDGSISTHKYGDTVKVLVGNDHSENTYELTAEKCIPSYHLKSLFLEEAEAILSKSGAFSDRHLQTIPYIIYDRLKSAVETQWLTTLFFPGENIYRQPQDDENLSAIIEMRMSYINTILRLLRELGFGAEGYEIIN
ncbi:hypothetical protein CHS0354_033394 [Potamilus streckersoni]|uniref:Mab-21-like nucleotidyltransferase domain-containing protein n=1 Tax=Potamilus streckersoni TaxID=2493646 RepID=A0AAE0VZZ9_9BIVA|nr:hypothetical protein CHS0354_033394 [Potamilus streckersoni]